MGTRLMVSYQPIHPSPAYIEANLAVNASYSFAIDLVSFFLDGQHPWYLPFASASVNILLAYSLRLVSNSHPLMRTLQIATASERKFASTQLKPNFV